MRISPIVFAALLAAASPLWAGDEAPALTNCLQIALQLGIGEARVEEHVNAIFSKINASNRAEAVAIALKKHLLKV